MIETSELYEDWHYLYEWRDDIVKILNTKQEFVPEYVWYSALH
jgi:hypothetical protein